MAKEEKLKIKWKVASKPTGRYRSFEHRGWPFAENEEGHLIASIGCDTEYSSKAAKSGQHGALTMYLYDYSEGITKRKMRKITTPATTLTEAKAVIEKVLNRHRDYLPKKEVDVIYKNVKSFLDQLAKEEIKNFVEKVGPVGKKSFLRSATISHLAYLFMNGKRMDAAAYLDRWIKENTK